MTTSAERKIMIALVPRPQRVEPGSGTFELTADTRIGADGVLAGPAAFLRSALATVTGFPLPALEDVGNGAVVDALRFVLDPGLEDEAYRLEVTPDGVEIRAATDRGGYWGAQTLLQLFPDAVHRSAPVAGVAWTAPAVLIEDAPAFRWRGAMLDVARHFVPTREVLRFIDLLAMHRLNILHLHLTDDQGWRIEIRRYPLLTEVGGWRTESQVGAGPDATMDGRPHGGFYTQDDIREIVAYAAARGVTVVPEIELPGHAQAAIAAYPHLGVTGAQLQPWTEWGINTNVFNVEESTIEFFRNVFDEIVELFPSPFVHVGGDECPKDQWRADARTQELMRERGVADEHALQSWFIGRVDEHLTARGRRLLGWDEILEGGLAPGATVLSWRGRVGAVAAARAGHDVITCPEDTVYLDYRQSDSPDEPIPVATVTTVADVYAFDPVPAELTVEEAAHVLGGQGNLWSEHADSPRTLDYLAFPRLSALAEALWTGGERDYAEFEPRLTAHLGRLDARGVEYRRADGPRPWQRRPGIPGRPEDRAAAEAHVASLTADLA
jgi:hexosaminidase